MFCSIALCFTLPNEIFSRYPNQAKGSIKTKPEVKKKKEKKKEKGYALYMICISGVHDLHIW